jgi:hypothetical protein
MMAMENSTFTYYKRLFGESNGNLDMMLTKYVHGLQDRALYHPNWIHFEGIMASQNFNCQNFGI